MDYFIQVNSLHQLSQHHHPNLISKGYSKHTNGTESEQFNEKKPETRNLARNEIQLNHAHIPPSFA